MASVAKYRIENLTSAQITALSHVFPTRSTQTQFMEVKCKDKILHIAVTQENILQSTKDLIIGGIYEITNLSWKHMHSSDGSIKKIHVTTSETTFVKLEAVKVKSVSGFVNYEGVVTAEICPALRTFELDHSVELHVGYLMHLAKLRLPQVGQTVSVYNAHWEVYDTRPCLILCGRAYVRVIDGEQISSRINHQTVLKWKTTYTNTWWIRRQLSSFEQKFPTSFLKAYSITSDSALNLLQKCLEVQYPDNMESTKSLSKDFISHPHSCGVYEKGEEYRDYERLKEFCNVNLKPDKCWSYRNIESEGCIVGVLTASMESGYWVLSDATYSVPCLITGNTTGNLHRALVLILHCTLIVELFQHGKSQCYIHVQMKNIKIIEMPGIKQNIRMKNVQKKLKVVENCEKEVDLLYHPLPASKDRSCLILLHHKTAVRRINDHICCNLLISRITGVNENADGIYSKSERVYLLLEGKLVQYVPLLHNNTMYKLVFPHSDRVFSDKSRLKPEFPALPDVSGFRLKDNCFICQVDSNDVAFLNSINDCYSVGNKELYEDLEPRELINIEGVICDRLHINSTFDSEKINNIVPGFGISDGKTVVLKLFDPMSENETTVSLYLNKWGHRAYPLGLVPGAKIQAMFVTMVISQSSANVYFKVTDLTRLYVLEIADLVGMSESIGVDVTSYQWGPSCILTAEASKASPGSLLWGLMRGAKILKFMASVSCAKCSMCFKRGSCTGCTAFPPEPKLTTFAKCYISDLAGQAIIIVKGDLLLTLFGIKKPYWDVITKLVSLDGKEITVPDADWNSEDPPGKKLLQTLVDVTNQRKRHFYVFCRKMKNSLSNENVPDRVPTLYCLDIQVPSAHLLYRSLEDS